MQSFRGSAVAQAASMGMEYPTPTVIDAPGKHTATIIMMHGLGDTAAGWVPVGHQLKGGLPHVKWVLPTAPTVRPLVPVASRVFGKGLVRVRWNGLVEAVLCYGWTRCNLAQFPKTIPKDDRATRVATAAARFEGKLAAVVDCC